MPELLSKYACDDVNECTRVLSFGNAKLSDISLQYPGVVLHPVGSPENCLTSSEDNKNFSCLQFGGLTNCQYEERNREGVASVIKQLPKW